MLATGRIDFRLLPCDYAYAYGSRRRLRMLLGRAHYLPAFSSCHIVLLTPVLLPIAKGYTFMHLI